MVAVVQLNSQSTANTEPASTGGWKARLDLAFEARHARTVLTRRAHLGPLQVQRPFYPPGDRACHVYILHPPGGVVGGDTLTITASTGHGAHALLTTPAAGKFYRSDSARAQLRQTLTVADGGWLEWLPQETIVFDGACAESRTRVELSGGAGFIGWEVLCLGRPAAGETFAHGELNQRFELWRDGQPLWWERNALRGGATALQASWGFADFSVVATLVVVGQTPHLLPALREVLLRESEGGEFSVTQLREVLVCRYLGDSAEQARAGFIEAWRLLRPAVWGVAATPPRIWAT